MKRTNLHAFTFCILLMATVTSSIARVMGSATNEAAENATNEPEAQNTTEQADAADKIPFSFDDVASNLVIITCQSPYGDTAGSGFIAKMDGKTYIFTNQHVIMGTTHIDFVTVKGEKLRPTGVELSLKRDIVRLPIADRTNALEVGGNAGMGTPLAVFGNSEGAGVATELYGKVTGVGADRLEVSAEFVPGNSGSPVIDKDKKVIGIASYVLSSHTTWMNENTRFENKARRFCYRLTDTRWIPVNWRNYNETYGNTYRENEALVDALFNVINGMYDKPFASVSANCSDNELKKWCDEHNRVIGRRGDQLRRDIGNCAEALSGYCQRRAHSLEDKLDKRDLTAFLREEFEGFVYAYESASDAIAYFGTKLPSISH